MQEELRRPAAAAVAPQEAATADAPPEASPATPEQHPTPQNHQAAPELALSSAKPAPSRAGRILQILSDLLLMLLQLLDAPFAWINDLDKNVIGFAAFLLLCSGLLLYAIAAVFH
jgi:hypothetical protein